jgi:hypothetical protein
LDESESLDPVGDVETIARFTNPDEWDDDGVHLRPDSIQSDDLIKIARGWSVHRVESTSLEQATKASEEAGKDTITVVVAIAGVASVRAIVDQAGSRCFFVLENAVPDNDCHALVYVQRGLGKGKVRQHRAKLIDALLRKNSLQEVFRPAA